jgi:hypothetical protein
MRDNRTFVERILDTETGGRITAIHILSREMTCDVQQ